MAIRIINMHRNSTVTAKPNEVVIRVDRQSIVGNPFYMHDESERDAVCEQYEEYFKQQMALKGEFYEEIGKIWRIAKHNDVALACWCAPKRCHAETIKRFIEQYL